MYHHKLCLKSRLKRGNSFLPNSNTCFSLIDCLSFKTFIKIILHRIISVVWLTNFLSEILSLTDPRWWVEQQILSVKRSWSLSKIPFHWWSPVFLYTGRWKELLLSEWYIKESHDSSRIEVNLKQYQIGPHSNSPLLNDLISSLFLAIWPLFFLDLALILWFL